MSIEILYIEGCPNYKPTLQLLQDVMAEEDLVLPIKLVRVTSVEMAKAVKFLGSPSIRIDGQDIERDAKPQTKDFNLKFRIYKVNWLFQGEPPKKMLREALQRFKKETS